MACNELAEDISAQSSLHHDCMSRTTALQAETNSRGEELKALATAKQIIEESTGGAALDQESLVQASRFKLTSGRDLHSYAAVSKRSRNYGGRLHRYVAFNSFVG